MVEGEGVGGDVRLEGISGVGEGGKGERHGRKETGNAAGS